MPALRLPVLCLSALCLSALCLPACSDDVGASADAGVGIVSDSDTTTDVTVDSDAAVGPTVDAGSEPDTSTTVDSDSTVDGGVIEGGSTGDSGVTDGGSVDGGSADGGSADGGSTADGGSLDGGSTGDGDSLDGGSTADGGSADGGSTVDSGYLDSSSTGDGGLASDGGSMADGGSTVDSGPSGDTSTVLDSGTTADTQPAMDATAGVDSGVVDVVPLKATKGGALAVELGGATDDATTFVPWTVPGQYAPLIFGPQVSYHVWVSVCLPSSVATTAKLAISMRFQKSGTPIIPGVVKLTTKLKPVAAKPGKLCRVAAPAFVTCACEVDKRVLRVRVEAIGTTSAGKAVTGWAEASIRPLHGKGPCYTAGAPPCAQQLP